MIVGKVIYNPVKLLYQYRVIITFCFLLFLIAKPIVHNSIVTENLKYELFENSEKENSSKIETLTDLDDESRYFYYNHFRVNLNKKPSFSNQLIGITFLNLYKDIKLPPPRV